METTKPDVREEVEQNAYQLNELIRPDDVTDSASEWSDVNPEDVSREISESIRVILSEGHYDYVLYDRALTLYYQRLRRISRDILMDISDEKLVLEHQIQPNRMDKWTCWEIIHENMENLNQVPMWDRHDAREELSDILYDYMWPSEVPEI